MSSVNNNIEISGKYKFLWHSQSDSYTNYKVFMAKLGMGDDLAYLNQCLTHLQVEYAMQDTIVLKFGKDWDTVQCTEVVKPGQMVEEVSFRSGGGIYSCVWYRCGNMLVKQARPSDKRDTAYTITREFTERKMVTCFSTDKNTLKAEVVHTRM
eukprot:GFUD01113878.1.p1 GENE.GFUD01113878.1~~GFUD01113878.1.p1  ORF type:complete len:153 (-),score=41.08 GFUD01113878.1:162-620(-)